MENYLATVQSKLKAPKNQYNNFGKYNYRSCEDILESLKPIINPDGYHILLTDEIVNIGDRNYIKATVTLSNGEKTYTAVGYAREEETKKGMDGSQITGASSSYARKYALNGLFAIDDAKDSDSTNKSEAKPEPAKKDYPEDNRPWLSEKQFNLALQRIGNGEEGIYEATDKAFKMKKDYRAQLKDAISRINQNNTEENPF